MWGRDRQFYRRSSYLCPKETLAGLRKAAHLRASATTHTYTSIKHYERNDYKPRLARPLPGGEHCPGADAHEGDELRHPRGEPSRDDRFGRRPQPEVLSRLPAEDLLQDRGAQGHIRRSRIQWLLRRRPARQRCQHVLLLLLPPHQPRLHQGHTQALWPCTLCAL